MNRENIFFLPKDAPSTFARDELLEKLPLPSLEDTLNRYERSLLPFASDNELKQSRKVIEDFKNGVGKKLHKMLAEKAAKERNWVSTAHRLSAEASMYASMLPLGRAILGRPGISLLEVPPHAVLQHGSAFDRCCSWNR